MDSTPVPEYPPAVNQPCNDCPWRRNATPGWLGPYDWRNWLRAIHGEDAIACHQTIGESGSWEGVLQCAGAAAFRANVCKRPRNPTIATGPPRDDVFATNEEFAEYHSFGEETFEAMDLWR